MSRTRQSADDLGDVAIRPGTTSPNNVTSASAASGELYFTAGPGGAKNELFGYLAAVSADLSHENVQ